MSRDFDDAYRRGDLAFGSEPDAPLARLIVEEGLSGRALDLGAGDGRNSLFLASRGFAVNAVDSSRAAVDKLNELACSAGLDIRAAVRDVREPEVIAGQYDVIVADTVLCQLSEEEARRAGAQITAALKAGGWLYATVFAAGDPRESEFAPLVRTYFDHDAFCSLFPHLRHHRCEQVAVTDTRHEPAHQHVLLRLVAQKEDASA